ncbi:MAG: (2Fe-2S)-binding protein [Gammaproteobacteria bacterium]|nr:(2Fe-2S)-binding protein [Gammaproteobacteria bacterium]
MIRDNQLESVIFIGPDHHLPSPSWLGKLFSKKSLSDNDRANILAGDPGGDQPDIGSLICACFGVGENTIKEAINCGQAKTVEDIGCYLKQEQIVDRVFLRLKSYLT